MIQIDRAFPVDGIHIHHRGMQLEVLLRLSIRESFLKFVRRVNKKGWLRRATLQTTNAWLEC